MGGAEGEPGRKEGTRREGGGKKRKGVKRVLVVRRYMIRGIEEELGELLGKVFEVKVVSMSGGKMWESFREVDKGDDGLYGGACGDKPHTEGDRYFRCGRVRKEGRKIER